MSFRPSFPARVALPLLTFALLLAPPPSRAQDRAPYLVGAVMSLSGNAFAAGESASAALDVVLRGINAHGGINGHPLQVRVLDDGGSAERAAALLQRLVSDPHVTAVIGATSASTKSVLEAAANRAQMPFVSLAPPAAGGGASRPWVFEAAVPDSVRVGFLIDAAKARRLERLAIVSTLGDDGKQVAKVAGDLASAAGLTIVDAETMAPVDQTADAQVVAALAKQPQAFLALLDGTRPITLAAAIARHERGLPGLADSAAATAQFLRVAGKAGYGWRVVAPKVMVSSLLPPADPLRARIDEFVRLYQADGIPDASAGTARDALVLLDDALARSGPDRAKLRDALESGGEVAGVMGVYRMTPADHGVAGTQGYVLIEDDAGRWRLAN